MISTVLPVEKIRKPRKPYVRSDRVASWLHRCIADVLRQHVAPSEHGLVTVSHVRVSRDLSVAWVMCTVVGDADPVIARLNRDAVVLRRLLCPRLGRMRKVPALRFQRDWVLEQGERVSHLLSHVPAQEH